MASTEPSMTEQHTCSAAALPEGAFLPAGPQCPGRHPESGAAGSAGALFCARTLAGKGSALTSFFSTAFLVVFLPFCLVVYSLMPRRGKKYFLLAADCAFFWLISGKLLVYLHITHFQIGRE